MQKTENEKQLPFKHIQKLFENMEAIAGYLLALALCELAKLDPSASSNKIDVLQRAIRLRDALTTLNSEIYNDRELHDALRCALKNMERFILELSCDSNLAIVYKDGALGVNWEGLGA
jgi:predicted component of type VI protein secretion system